MRQSPFLRRAGFSLLELVTVMAIALLLGALAFPQLNRYWQSYRLDSAAQTLTSNLELARYSAISKDVNVVVAFYPAAFYYESFEDKNGNGTRDTGEVLLGSFPLPGKIEFKGAGLLGPPSSPSGPVTDPITFSNDRVVFNSQGKLNGGLGSIYLQNGMNDAAAISYNITGRMKTYRWDKSSGSWK
jgi:prepilin-type N-terminal cleavage/methylation domain-containing protein